MDWIQFRKKENREKGVVFVDYKGPGMAELSASNLEVVPSLFNTLKRMQAEGYDLGGQMPESPDALFELIQNKGDTIGLSPF